MITEAWKKSSASGGTDCLEARWEKSSYSHWNGGCVEARQGGAVQVRDSKQNGRGPILEFSPGSWMSFINDIKSGKIR